MSVPPLWPRLCLGGGKLLRLFVYVTIGNGIRHALIHDGRPFRGAYGNAITVASGAPTTHCPACGVRSDFVVEEFASGLALVARYNKLEQRADRHQRSFCGERYYRTNQK